MGEVEEYVHKIGRTARGLSGQGHALTLFEYDPKYPWIPGSLVRVLEQAGQIVPPSLKKLAADLHAIDEDGWGFDDSWKSNGGKSAKMLNVPVQPLPTAYWQYQWCASTSGETFGPFDGQIMSEWQQANLFTANPAQARRCTSDGQVLEGQDWQPADQAQFIPTAGSLDTWSLDSSSANAKKRKLTG